MENNQKLEIIADWLEIIQSGDATGEIGVGLPPIEDVLTKNEMISLKIAVRDGWTGLKLYSETATRRQFIGYNENLAAEWGIYIPNYAKSIDAIVGALKRIDATFNLYVYSPKIVERGDAEGLACAESLTDVNRGGSFGDGAIYGSTEAIALCNLYLAIAPSTPKAKPLIEVLDLGSGVFEVDFL